MQELDPNPMSTVGPTAGPLHAESHSGVEYGALVLQWACSTSTQRSSVRRDAENTEYLRSGGSGSPEDIPWMVGHGMTGRDIMKQSGMRCSHYVYGLVVPKGHRARALRTCSAQLSILGGLAQRVWP